MINYSQQTKSLLEFDTLIEELLKFFHSNYTKEYFKHHILLQKYSKLELEKQYQLIYEYQWLQSIGATIPIASVYDFSDHIDRMDIENYFLNLDEIIYLRTMTSSIRDIKLFFKETKHQKEIPNLVQFSNAIFYDSAILREIDKIVDEEGELLSSASKLLHTIRERKKVIFAQIDKTFMTSLQQAKESGYLHEIGESIRQGRRVLAVSSTYKRSVRGMIVDESDSGNIAYIEPESTIHLNNEASQIKREEDREIRRILIELTKFLSKYSRLIMTYQEHLTQWDILQAKSRFMNLIGGSIPQFSSIIDLKKAYHPLLKIKNAKEKKNVVPFSVSFSEKEKMLMISGPNAGGKSITLKTIGIVALMVQYAIPIPAESNSKMPLFNEIIGDLGDLQSIQDELSTYSSKLKLWNYMMKISDNNILFLFDELGDGTDPSFGTAMAQSVLEYILNNKSTIIATSHYGDIKRFAQQRSDTLSANMKFDEAKLEPMYQLSLGLPGSSYTFHIARKMGLNQEIVTRAEFLSNKEEVQYDKKLFKIEKKEKELFAQKNELEKTERELKKQMKDWNRLHLDLDLMRKKIKYEKMIAHQEQILEKEREMLSFKDDLKKKKKQEELLIEQKRLEEEKLNNEKKAKELYREIHQISSNQELKSGDKVRFIQTNAIGIIEKIQKKKAIVLFDHLKSTIALNELILVKEDDNHRRLTPKKIITIDKTSSRELDLRGKYVYEAIPEIENFINTALLNNFPEIKIIHGKGKLKSEIHKTLQGFRSIDHFSHPLPEHGGDGVTLIYF